MPKEFTHEDGLKLEQKIKHELRNEFTPMFHNLTDKLDSLIGIATKNEIVTENIEKAFNSHTTKEEQLLESVKKEVEKARIALDKENKLQDKKIDSKLSTSEFWKVGGSVIAILFALLIIVYNKTNTSDASTDARITANESKFQGVMEKMTKIELILEYGFTIEQEPK